MDKTHAVWLLFLAYIMMILEGNMYHDQIFTKTLPYQYCFSAIVLLYLVIIVATDRIAQTARPRVVEKVKLVEKEDVKPPSE